MRRGPGRRPTPTVLKLLRGNPGWRPINPAEPKPARRIPDPPASLSADARAEWDRLAPTLFRLGVLTEIDGIALREYCTLSALSAQIDEEFARLGSRLLVTEKMGDPPNQTIKVGANPLIAMKRHLTQQLRGYLIEFGLTPASRSKIQLDLTPSDRLGAFLETS